MRPYSAPNTSKYVAIVILSTIAMCFVTAIVFGILEMKKEEKRKQEIYDYMDRMCTPLEYGIDKKPTKYSCENIIFNK
ncbi:hypothetical protein AVU18_gp199 [Citrobacter phage IME-CF2]|jgi:hypothetical protein|uniref:Uncharacterized protein n=5 Tax=Pseudotevenvirus TaxID=2842979 RepID=A0A1B1IXT9_9CAUD|nr:hypothetical protein CPTMiller_003 [Citrobacter phage Miller]YP_009218723.1 hypothetical protein AVU18_gp199 [Citrobacter phage IME-CF2]YP_009285542.1 hypothetical protein BI032_gp004 [Citrobacter phage vB_CfrM_CfP1]YP_238978.1 hypothetical protein RB43ORF002c [Escherichia phage RB43]QPX73132.1 hypothetical protein [Citrobacter phage vB_Cfr_Xman]CCK73850.1 protein of unknown function [Pseudotevenvirus RB43]AAX78524.1 hypothetical protein RB43ORF002c [Escherichia phage RB43]AIK67939.1 hypo